MNTIHNCIVRVVVAILSFLVLGFISLLILKVSFGNPYDPVIATNTGYILLLVVVLCVLLIDNKVKNIVLEKTNHEYL